MAHCTLYKKGKTHVIRGIECTAKRFHLKHLEAAQKAGWSTDPNNLVSKPGRKALDPVPDPEPETPKVETGTPDATES